MILAVNELCMHGYSMYVSAARHMQRSCFSDGPMIVAAGIQPCAAASLDALVCRCVAQPIDMLVYMAMCMPPGRAPAVCSH